MDGQIESNLEGLGVKDEDEKIKKRGEGNEEMKI